MARLILFFIFAIAVAVAPFVAAWVACARVAGRGVASADVFGWRPQTLVTVLTTYAVAVALVGGLTALRYAWLVPIWLALATVMIVVARRLPLPAAGAAATHREPAASEAVDGETPATSTADALLAAASVRETRELRATRERFASVGIAIVALVFCGVFSLGAATVAAVETREEADPVTLAVLLLGNAQPGDALIGTVPEGRPEGGLRVALVVTPTESGIEYRVYLRGPGDALWIPSTDVLPFTDTRAAVDHLRDTYGIERFTAGVFDAETGPTPAGSD